ncbi:clostripain-related cysteine peptidase [Candidatus Neomarinimicrobiota bacterium]
MKFHIKYFLFICIMFITCDYFNDSSNNNKKTWTIMLYIDEDTGPIMQGRFNHMKNNICSNDNINVVVIEDQNYQSANYWYIDEGFEPFLLEELPEVNMGDSKILSDFIEYSKDKFPANRYLLALFDHGGAWQGACWDQSHDMDNLTPPEMEQALKLNGGVDIILMVACAMGAIEPIYQLSDITDVYIGSENAIFYDFFGRAWDEIMFLLKSNLLTDTKILGDRIVDALWYAEGLNIDNQIDEITLAAYESKKIKHLVELVDELSELYIQDFSTFKNNLDTILPLIEYNRANKIDFFDLMSLIYQYENNSIIKDKLNEILDYFDSIIINEKHGNNIGFSNGISIYLPLPSLEGYNPDYSSNDLNLKFANDTHWDELLEMYYLQSNNIIINYVPKINPLWDTSGQ